MSGLGGVGDALRNMVWGLAEQDEKAKDEDLFDTGQEFQQVFAQIFEQAVALGASMGSQPQTTQTTTTTTTTTQAQSDESDEVDWGKVLDDAYNDVIPEPTPEEPSLPPELQAMLDQALQEMEALNANAPQAPQQVGRKLLETLNPLIQKNMAEMMRGMFIQQLLFCRQDPVVFRARIVMGAQVCSALSKGEQPDDPMVKQLQALGISPDNLPNTQQGLTQLKANLTNVLQILEMPAEEQDEIMKSPRIMGLLDGACIYACCQSEGILDWIAGRQEASLEEGMLFLLENNPAQLLAILQREHPDSYEKFKEDMKQELKALVRLTEDEIKMVLHQEALKAHQNMCELLEKDVKLYQENPEALREEFVRRRKQVLQNEPMLCKEQYAALSLDNTVKAKLLQAKDPGTNLCMAKTYAFSVMPEALTALRDGGMSAPLCPGGHLEVDLGEIMNSKLDRCVADYLVNNFYNKQ